MIFDKLVVNDRVAEGPRKCPCPRLRLRSLLESGDHVIEPRNRLLLQPIRTGSGILDPVVLECPYNPGIERILCTAVAEGKHQDHDESFRPRRGKSVV